MSVWAIIATGPSLKDEEVDIIKQLRESGRLEGVIAVNNAGLDKATWADALVAHDSIWWMSYPKSLEFTGRKFSKYRYSGTEIAPCSMKTCNSGLLAMFVARDVFKAKTLILLGFDFKGTHYFGPHTAGVGYQKLRNTTDERFLVHIKQFEEFSGCNVINCNIESALELFPKVKMSDILQTWNFKPKSAESANSI